MSAATTALYNPHAISVGPFPSNVLTKADPAASTGLQIRLDGSGAETCDLTGPQSVCSNAALLNQLDGFNLNPRVMACFSGPVDLTSIQQGLRIIPVNSPGTPIPLNQVIYDPVHHCAFGKPDHILDQRTSYLFAVTGAVRDQTGGTVSADPAFTACLQASDSYCQTLARAVRSVPQGTANDSIVSASLFTTMTATGWLESVRDALGNFPIAALPAGPVSTFSLSGLRSITWYPDGTSLPPQKLPLDHLDHVGKVSFGLFLSPNYLNLPDPTNPSAPTPGTITNPPTQPVDLHIPGVPPGFEPVSYHVFIPKGVRPFGGWPIVIYGHGLSDNQFGAPSYIASQLAANGFATLAIEITGHGYGPAGSVSLLTKDGSTFSVQTPGRGVRLSPGTDIGAQDGCVIPGPIAIRDCGRQTVVDLLAFVKTIGKTNGLGLGLNAGRIYYIGQSFGSIYGSLFHAIEPTEKAAVINAGGGTFTDVARLALTARPLGGIFLAQTSPLLLNVPPQPAAPYFQGCLSLCFNDEYPYRDRPPFASQIDGALADQAAFEAAEWLGMLGDPLAYAPHFKTDPLPGVPPKATLFQFGLGDLEVPNPTESALVRAADGQDHTWFFRFDRAWQIHDELLTLTGPDPTLPILPHRILSNTTIFDEPSETPLALAEQQQAATFFALNGIDILDPNWLLPWEYFGRGIFQRPSVLPESLQYQQIPPK